MISIVGQGFLLGLAYAMPIGAQNLYVINSASKGKMDHAMRTAFIFAIMDISLGIACILGIGRLIQANDWVRIVIGSIGSVCLLHLGYKLFWKSRPTFDLAKSSTVGSLWKAAFLLTWCNPHALLDGTVLLGSYQTMFTAVEVSLFVAGLALASSTWFFSLSTVVNQFKSAITPHRIYVINRICGLSLLIFGLRLLYSVAVG